MINKEGVNKYFIALVPPSPVYEEALELKHYFREHYNSKSSLNSPPHITLHMPFEWKEKKESTLVQKLHSFFKEFHSFTIQLKNFGCFDPRVIFIAVEQSEELNMLQKELERFCKRTFQLFHAQYRDEPFHPHITIAFRDLKRQLFAKAWQEFSNKVFLKNFLVDHVALLKHNGKKWIIFERFFLA